jgi:outer membrane lipase/esterase
MFRSKAAGRRLTAAHASNRQTKRRHRALLAALSLAATTPVIAQQFTRNVGFGDSYVDTGTIVNLVGAPLTSYYPTGRFSGGTNFFDTTSSLLGIPQVNYALGGATSGTTGFNGLPNLGFTTEVAGFVGSGQRFSSTDLVTISIGGNDARGYYQTGGTLAGVGASATNAAAQATAGINALAGAGAKTIVFTAGNVGLLPETAAYGSGAQTVATAYSAAYNSAMQTSLAAVAARGVRVEYIDQSLVLNAILANPAATTIRNTICSAACIGNPALASQYLFYFDGIHLTSAGFEVLGKYVVNRLNAPLTFAAVGQTGVSTVKGFASTMLGRADLFAAQASVATSVAPASTMNLGMGASSSEPAMAVGMNSGAASSGKGLQAYILAKGGIDQAGATSINPSYSTISDGGTIGLEYKYSRALMAGIALDYTNATSRLANAAGRTSVDAYQLGLYAAYNPSNFFAQGLVSYGTQSYKNTRAGVLLGDVTSTPSGTSAAAAAKIGYLFDTYSGALRIGPIAGLTYASSTTKAYTEAGDAALTLSVGKQTVEALVGSAGIQMRAPIRLAGQTLLPYLNLTAEQDFKGNGRSVQYSATSAPLIINTFNIDDRSHKTYGRIAAGVSADVTSNAALNLSLSQTFGQGANSFNAVGGISIRF